MDTHAVLSFRLRGMPIKIELTEFDKELAVYTELSSVALGGQVISVSDEFFAEACNLLKVEAAPSLKGQFGPNGALYSGWETKRHNPTFDWCIIKLGATGKLHGFDIDTSHFSGNEAPAASVEACFVEGEMPPSATDPVWEHVLPRQTLGPNSRHLFKFSPSERTTDCNYVKLNIFPDGGVARFRVYGIVVPIITSNPDDPIDLAHVFSGGRVVSVSDQHYGKGSNLLLPGRGKDMGDGWETKRSREVGHKDRVIIRLGQSGILDSIEIDTNHFKGNYPQSCEIHACSSPYDIPNVPEEQWVAVLPRTKLQPHVQQRFGVTNVSKNIIFTHIKVTIYPDGGIKRVRVIGHRANLEGRAASGQVGESLRGVTNHSAVLITPEEFTRYGQVIRSWEKEATPSTVKRTTANQGTALKFHNLALVESSYPAGTQAKTGFSVYRSSSGAKFGDRWKVNILERHPCTNQAFIPMEPSVSGGQIGKPRMYLIIVALNGDDDSPALSTLRAFVVPTSQGIVYNTGVWHHPILTIENDIDFTCVETQMGDGNELDCEIRDITESVEVQIPALSSLTGITNLKM